MANTNEEIAANFENADSNHSRPTGFDENEIDAQNFVGDSTYEGVDPKVEEYLNVLEEYRTKCEREGLYDEAQRVSDQLKEARKHEEDRRMEALRTRHILEKEQMMESQQKQERDFHLAWEKYMEEFDAMAAMFVKQLQLHHLDQLHNFQERLHAELVVKPVKHSRDLLDLRQREQLLVKQRQYAEATRIKAQADALERKDREQIDAERLSKFALKESKFRQQQTAEVQALLKRIETRRAEHVKQRREDSRRLVQRNKNVAAVLESRQSHEHQRALVQVRVSMQHRRPLREVTAVIDTGLSVSVSSGKRLTQNRGTKHATHSAIINSVNKNNGAYIASSPSAGQNMLDLSAASTGSVSKFPSLMALGSPTNSSANAAQAVGQIDRKELLRRANDSPSLLSPGSSAGQNTPVHIGSPFKYSASNAAARANGIRRN